MAMTTFPWRTLLVPTDFSACADAALSLADRLASQGGAGLIVMHASELSGGLTEDTIVQPGDGRKPVRMGDFARETAATRMKQQVDRLKIRSPVSFQVILDKPVEAIIEAARQAGACAIAMGTHGRTGLDHLIAGSVTERVVRLAPVPVITVRGGCPADAETEQTEAEQILLDESSG